jgi:hypothetical protein
MYRVDLSQGGVVKRRSSPSRHVLRKPVSDERVKRSGVGSCSSLV